MSGNIAGMKFWRGAQGAYSTITADIDFNCPVVFDSTSGTLSYIYRFTVVALGIKFEVNITNSVNLPFGTQKVLVIDIKVSPPAAPGFTATGTFTASSFKNFTLPGRYSSTVTGTISVTGVFREWLNTDLVGDSGLALPGIKLTATPRWKQNETWTASMNIGGDAPCSVSITGVAPVPGTGFEEFGVNLNASIYSGTSVDLSGDNIKVASGTPPTGQQGTAVLTFTKCRISSGAISLDADFGSSLTNTFSSGSYHSISGSAGSLVVTCANQTNGGVSICSFLATAWLPCDCDFDGLVTRFFNPNYADNVKMVLSWEVLTITAASGIYAQSKQFLDRTVTLDGTSAVTGTFRTLPTLSGNLESAWMSAQSVPSNDSALYILDEFSWSPTTFSQSGAAVGVGVTADWTGTNASVSVSGSTLTITGTATPASASKANYTADFRNHRYLRINASCTSSRTVRVTIGSKYWDIAVTSTASDFDLDLCAPTSSTVVNDSTDSSWQAPGAFYGLQAVTSIQFGGIQNGDVLTISSVSLVQKESVRGWLTDTHNASSLEDWYKLGADGNRYSRIVTTLASGKQAGDLPHAKRTDGTSTNRIKSTAQGDAAEERLSVSDLISVANASNQAGIACSPGAVSASPIWGASGNYYDPAKHYAASLTLDSLSSRVQFTVYGTEPDMSSVGLNCIPAYQQYTLYYGASLLVGSNRKIRFTKRLMGIFHGLCISPSGGISGDSVSVTGTVSPAETAITNTLGYWRSLPRVPENNTITFHALNQSRNITARYGRWAGFGGTAQSNSYGAIETDSARGWLHVGKNAKVLTYYQADYSIAFQSTDYSAVDGWNKLRVDSRLRILYMLGLKGSSAWHLLTSGDGGMTGTEVLTMTARTAVLEVSSESGVAVLLYENSGNVTRRYSNDGGTTWSTAADVTYNGTPLQGQLLDMAHDIRFNARLSLVITQSGNTIVLSSNNWGADWTLRLS